MTAPSPFTLHRGTAPLLISFPHVGTHVPPALAARLTPKAREVHDTDWHLPRLYDFARGLGASLLIATHSRYVIDLNRPPDGASLYPGQSVTALCPVDDFDGESILSLMTMWAGKSAPDGNRGQALVFLFADSTTGSAQARKWSSTSRRTHEKHSRRKTHGSCI